MIEIWDQTLNGGFGDWRALAPAEELAEGDRYRETLPNGSWIIKTFHEAVPEDITSALHRRRRDVYRLAKEILDGRFVWYSEAESYLWPALEVEVDAYNADNNVKGPNILAREAQGVTAAKTATDTADNATLLRGIVATVVAKRTEHLDALQALHDAPDLGGLLAYDITTGWPDFS